ncbi:hypothetical protein ACFX13_044760 [Malus domestica]
MRSSTHPLSLSLTCDVDDHKRGQALKKHKSFALVLGKQSKSIYLAEEDNIISKLPQRSCSRYNSGRRIRQVFWSWGRRWCTSLALSPVSAAAFNQTFGIGM